MEQTDETGAQLPPADGVAPPEPRAADDLDLLEAFTRREEEALSAARTRVTELEARAKDILSQHPERLRSQVADVQRRIQSAQSECDRNLEMLRANLAGGRMAEDEFRSALFKLEMEYASRCRLAEHGVGLVAEELGAFLSGAAGALEALCTRLRDTLGAEASNRYRFVEVLRIEEDRRRRVKERLGHAVDILHKVHHRLQSMLAERTAGREESKKVLGRMELKLRALADEVGSQRSRFAEGRAAPPPAPPDGAPLPPDDAALRLAAAEAELDRVQAQRREAALLLAETERSRDEALAAMRSLREELDAQREETLKARREASAASIPAVELGAARERADRLGAELAAALADLETERRAASEVSQAREAERGRAAARLEELSLERDAARADASALGVRVAALEAELKAQAEELARAIVQGGAAAQPPAPARADVGGPPPAAAAPAAGGDAEAEELRERLQEASAARDQAQERARQAEAGLAGMLSKLADAEEREKGDGQRSGLRKTAGGGDAGKMVDVAAAGLQRLLADLAEHQERSIQAERQLATERAQADNARRSFEETMMRQDGARLKEIFALRSKLEGLESRVQGAAAAQPAAAKAPDATPAEDKTLPSVPPIEPEAEQPKPPRRARWPT